MDVTLHIGAHRSGSTTLQQFLQRNETALLRANVEAWTPDRTRSGLFSGLIQHPNDRSPHTEVRAKRSSGVIRIEVERLERAGCRTLIISDENLMGAVRDNLREGSLYPTVAGRLDRLGPALADKVTRVALCVRSYDSFWASCVVYGVAQGHRVPGPAKLDKIVHQTRRWRDVAKEAALCFPKADIVVWPFERFCGQPETQLAILAQGVQIGPAFNGAREWHNPSPRLEKLRRILSLRGDGEMAARLPSGDGRWTPFDDAQRSILRHAYHDDLDWFAKGAEGCARWVDTPPGRGMDRDNHPAPMPERHYEVSGFATTPQTWMPPEGGQNSGNQRIVV